MRMTHLALVTSRRFVLCMTEQGPAYGYFPEPKKSCLIVTPHFVDEATRLVFGDLGVQISEWTSLSCWCNRRLHESGQFCGEEGSNVGRLC